jgi:hypothetical protein
MKSTTEMDLSRIKAGEIKGIRLIEPNDLAEEDEVEMKEKSYEQVLDEMIEEDKVNNPSHYQGKFGLEAIDVVRNFAGNLTAVQGFYWGNAIKYLLRFQGKNGLEDLKKARKNLDWLIEEMEK